jgi:predicted aspartyl protease
LRFVEKRQAFFPECAKRAIIRQQGAKERMMRRLFAFLAGISLVAGAAAAQTRHQTGSLAAPPDEEPAGETVGYLADAANRMTVAVNVDGRGPFHFVVDTGAERTVVSNELAQQLALDPGDDVTVMSVSRSMRVPSVFVTALEVGRRTIPTIQAPSLARQHIGAEGMLGVDSLQSQRVVFDFRNRQLSLSTSHLEDQNWPGDAIVVTGRSLAGRLILTDANLDGQRIRVIIDTGSQVTIANSALRAQLSRRGRLGQVRTLELQGVTGDVIQADFTRAGRIRIGDVHVEDLPIAFADVELFNLLGLRNKPAILLGMDALRMFDRVSIDFANRRVRLLPPRSASRPLTELASAGGPPRAARLGARQ